MIGNKIASGVFKSMFSTLSAVARHPLAAPSRALGVYKSGLSGIGRIVGGGSLTRKSLYDIGRHSAKMLGTTAALTYAYRGVRAATGGPGVFKNRKGKRDIIPFMPLI